MMVRLFGSSGLTNTYRSVLSAPGSPAMSGASRWLDAAAPVTVVAAMRSAPATAAALVRDDTEASLLSGAGLSGPGTLDLVRSRRCVATSTTGASQEMRSRVRFG